MFKSGDEDSDGLSVEDYPSQEVAVRVQLQRAIEEERYSSNLLKSHVIQTWLLHRQLQPESYWHPHSYVHDADMTRLPSFATACSSCSRGIRMLLQSRAQTWQAQLGSSASTLGSVWNTGSLGTAQLCMGGGPFSIQLLKLVAASCASLVWHLGGWRAMSHTPAAQQGPRLVQVGQRLLREREVEGIS